MPHKKELLETIARKVSRDYSSLSFQIEFERALTSAPERMIPDLLVTCKKTKKVVCVVEIGYTRPEKLTRYARMGIKDVRWYDKKAVLHNASAYRRIKEVPTVSSKQQFECLHLKEGYFGTQCDHCIEELIQEEGLDIEDSDDFEEVCKIENETRAASYVSVITDWTWFWGYSMCDLCGRFKWIESALDCDLEYDLFAGKEIDLDEALAFHPGFLTRVALKERYLVTWSALQHWVVNETDLVLRYQDRQALLKAKNAL